MDSPVYPAEEPVAIAPRSNTTDDVAREKRRAASIAAGWTYFHSESLGLECAVKNTPFGPCMVTSDRVEYLPSEINMLKKIGGEVPRAVHELKRLFDGEIVEYP